MKDIRFYDLLFNLIYIEPKYLSVHFCEKLSGTGSFEIHLPPGHADNLSLPCLVVFGDFCGIATGLRTSSDTAVFGKTLNFLLSKRICLPFTADTESGAEIMQRLTDTYISDFAVFENTCDFTAEADFAVSNATPLLNVVTRLCSSGGHCLAADFDAKKYVLKFLPRRSSPLRLSADTGVADNLTHTVNCSSYASYTRFGDKILEPDALTGVYRWEAMPSGDSESESLDLLLQQKVSRSISADIRRLIYGKDYFLGDIFDTDSGVRAVMTEITCDCDSDGERYTPVFEVI